MDEFSTGSLLEVCPVCGHREFDFQEVLWRELVAAWELQPYEAGYIDLQQGFHCATCKNNLRAMTLAAAVTRAFGFAGNFEDFCRSDAQIRALTVVEVNAVGRLSRYLENLPHHQLHCFPQLDLQRMSFESGSIDVMIHSDTLEHVPDSRTALRESRRVLKPGGRLFYTVPIIVDRMTRTRQGLPASYHGGSQTSGADYKVQTEYGANFWCEIFETGFREVTLTSLVFPASVAISVTKT
jgi:SAM-dependent methyltransferase